MIASWGIAAAWIAFEIFIPPHRTEDILWRASIALALVAAASCLLVIWYLLGAIVEPANTERALFRIAYRSGWLDRDAGQAPASLYLLPSQRADNQHTSDTGTGNH